jgi:hypothetical protein
MTIFLVLGAPVESAIYYYDSSDVCFVKQNIFVSHVRLIQVGQEGINWRLAFIWCALIRALYCK